jgi:hypothetical protein
MRMVSAIISLFLAVVLMAIGVFIGMMPKAPHFAQRLSCLISSGSYLLYLIGGACFVVGASVLLACFFMNRRSVMHLKMGRGKVDIELPVIEESLQRLTQAFFPRHEVPVEVRLVKGQLYLAADLPYVPFDEQKPLLQNIEKKTMHLLAKSFGYCDEFTFSVSFADKA